MGVASSRREPVGIMLLGLDAVGKTTLLYKLRQLGGSDADIVTTVPTIGFAVETLEDVLGLRLTSWDVGGADKLRPLWRHYYEQAKGLIFVVDASDTDRRDDEREGLRRLLGEEQLRGWPLLVLANKQDRAGARTAAQVTDDLRLPSLRGRCWHVAEAVLTTGDGIEALDWLRDAVGAGKKPAKRDWKALAADLDSAGELLFTWACGRSDRAVDSDVADAAAALRPHLLRMADSSSPSPEELTLLGALCPAGGLWPGHSALQICAVLGNIELVRLLLAAKAPVDTLTSCREPTGERNALGLALAAGHNTGGDVTAWVEMLLSAGADATATLELSSAAPRPATQQRGDDTAPPRRTNMLMYALTTRSPSTVVKALLEHGADPNAGACLAWDVGTDGHRQPVNAGFARADCLGHNVSPLRAAIIHGDQDGKAVDSVDTIILHGGGIEGTAGTAALMDAIIQADIATVTMLLEQGVVPTARHIVEAASKLDGPMPHRHFLIDGLMGSPPSERAIAVNTRLNPSRRDGPSPAVAMVQALLDRANVGTVDATVANAACLAAVRALAFLTAKDGATTLSLSDLGPSNALAIKRRGEGCAQLLTLLADLAEGAASWQWSLPLCCAKVLWPARPHHVHYTGADRSRYDHLVDLAEEDPAAAAGMLSAQAAALDRGEMLPFPTLLHVLSAVATCNLHEEIARLAFLPAASVMVARGCSCNAVYLEPTPPNRDSRRGDYALGAVGPGPCDDLLKHSAPPLCTPIALALREARSVDAMVQLLLSLDGAVVEPAEDEEERWLAAQSQPLRFVREGQPRRRRVGYEWVYPEASGAAQELAANWSDGQCTLCDELLGSEREQNAAALQHMIDRGWHCSQTQAQRTLAALLPDASVARAERGQFYGQARGSKQDAMRLLRTLFEQDRGGEPGRCGQVFRIALSPHVFEQEREGRPLTLALEYHDEQLLAVLLRAGSVVLPADHSVIEAMARRKDVQLPSDAVALVHYQMLLLARQRLAFTWGAHVRRDDVSNDADVLAAVGQRLLTSDALRPGWLGRVASECL
jgi:small GTP-binding protein